MGMILCATRGGEESYPTQDAVIVLAKEKSDELVFLYVVDTSFLDQTAEGIVVDVESSLEKLGRFQLVMAQERAALQGLKVQVILRQGQLSEELAAVAKEIKATLIVLGGSAGPDAAFRNTALKDFAKALQAKTGIEVSILERKE